MEIFTLDEQLSTYQYFDNQVMLNEDQLTKFLFEDIDVDVNEKTEVKINRIRRYRAIVEHLKELNGFKCQICGSTFRMDNGNYYCEAHHIKHLSQGGSQAAENIVILCANHHRMIHFAPSLVKVGEMFNGQRMITLV